MNKYLSIFTFLFITSLVMTGATSVVSMSINQNPNPVLIASLIRPKPTQYIAINNDNLSGVAVLGASTESINTNNSKNCQPSLLTSLSKNRSLVDFLYKNNQEYSFESRTALADKMGINDYKGTADQNAKLITILIAQNQGCIE